MSATDQLLENARRYAADFDRGGRPMPPAQKVAVVACMDARIVPSQLLGLDVGDAHVIRNAGGVVSSDTIRSLAISQRLLGTEEIVLVHHTDCGMLTFDDEEDVRQSMARIHASPFLPKKDAVRGFVYDVDSGELREIS